MLCHNIIPYKFQIKWSRVTIEPHFKPSSVILEHKNRTFFKKHIRYMNSPFLPEPFHKYPFYLTIFSCLHLFQVSCSFTDQVLSLSGIWSCYAVVWQKKKKMLRHIHHVYNIQLSLNWQQLMFCGGIWYSSHADHMFSN